MDGKSPVRLLSYLINSIGPEYETKKELALKNGAVRDLGFSFLFGIYKSWMKKMVIPGSGYLVCPCPNKHHLVRGFDEEIWTVLHYMP